MKTNKGFTLIELLVVIAIIGVLSSVVLASLTAARAKARDAKRVATLKEISKALEIAYQTDGAYPAVTCFSAWSAANWGCGPSSGGVAFYTALVASGLLTSLSNDPTNSEKAPGDYLFQNGPNGDLVFLYTSNGQSYILGANLETVTGTASRCGSFQMAGGASPYACPV